MKSFAVRCLAVLALTAAPVVACGSSGTAGEFVYSKTAAQRDTTGYGTLTSLPDGRLFLYGSPVSVQGEGATDLGAWLSQRRKEAGSQQAAPSVWNAAQRSWTKVERPPGCRYNADLATATLLTDARVLIAGGLCDEPRMWDDVSPQLPHTGLSVWNSVSGRWEDAPSLAAPRMLHTASRLADGSVLIVGGESDPLHTPDGQRAVLGSVERYRAGHVEAAPALQTARARHTATALADGTLLVAGGRDGNGKPLSSVEIWDDRAASWLAAPALRHARQGHLAALLNDGRVLIAGGVGNEGEPLSSVEIWDPATRAWSAGEPLPIPLFGQALTKLANGDLLLLGSGRVGRSVGTALLWRHAEGRWVPAGTVDNVDPPMLVAPWPNGTASVYAANKAFLWRPTRGQDGAFPIYPSRERHATTATTDGRILLSGGLHEGRFLDAAELFEPGTGHFSLTGRMRLARHSHQGIALPDGRVVVAGGWARAVDDPSRPLPPTPEVWDPRTGLWHFVPGLDLQWNDWVHAGLLEDGSVLFLASRELFEGERDEPVSYRAWRWVSATGKTERLVVPLLPRADAAVAIRADGTVLVAGGTVWTHRPAQHCGVNEHSCSDEPARWEGEREASAELWDIHNAKVQPLPPLPDAPLDQPRTLVLRGGDVLISYYQPLNVYAGVRKLPMVLWSAKAAQWRSMPAIPSFHAGQIIELPDGQLLSPRQRLLPGATEWVDSGLWRPHSPLLLSSREAVSLSIQAPHLARFDSKTASWKLVRPIDAPLSWLGMPTVTALPDGRAMVVGDVGEFRDAAQIWSGSTGRWSDGGHLSRRYTSGQAVTLPSGDVLHLGQIEGGIHVCEHWRATANEWAFCGSLTPHAGTTKGFVLGQLADGRAAVVSGPETLVFDEAGDTWHAMPMEWNAEPLQLGAPIRVTQGYYARVRDAASGQWVDASDLAIRTVQASRGTQNANALWNAAKREWAFVFHGGLGLGRDAVWLPDGCALSVQSLRLFNPKTGRITPLQAPLTAVDLEGSSSAVLSDGTVVAVHGHDSMASERGVFFYRKATCAGFEPGPGEEMLAGSSGAPRPAVTAKSNRAETDHALKQFASRAWQFRWVVLLLLLPVLGYWLARRGADKSERRDVQPSRGFRWALRIVFYGVAAVVILPLLVGYLSVRQVQRQDECSANPSNCLDERGLVERVPALVSADVPGSEQTRIPCRYVGVWSSIRPKMVLRITLHDDGRYVAEQNRTGAEASAHDRYEGYWAVQGQHMLWRHRRNDPGRPDVNRIREENAGGFTLVEEDGSSTRFERLESVASSRCVP